MKDVTSVVLLVKQASSYLAVSRRDDHADFGLPGGKVDVGEEPKDSLVREVYEETGIQIQAYDLIKVFDREDSTGHYVFCYLYHGNAFNKFKEGIYEDNGGLAKMVSKVELLTGSFGDYNRELFKKLELI